MIVVPDNFDDPFSLSSFPKEIPDLASIPKMMLVSQKIQEFALYEHGSLIRFGAVSTGKKSTPSPSRLYYTNWKGKSVTSSIDDEWIMPWYFNLDNMEGISMHQFDLPGYAASHSCVRMSEDNAKFIYDWADQWILSLDDTVIASGTPVLLFDEYVYGKPGPWKKLPEDSHVMTLSVDYLEQKITPNLDDIQKKQTERDAVIAEKTNSL